MYYGVSLKSSWYSASIDTHNLELGEKQGRIHEAISRVWLGWGSDKIDNLDDWAGAVMQKPPGIQKCDLPTDRSTDRHGKV